MTLLSYSGDWRAEKGRGGSCRNIGRLSMECIHDTNADFMLQGKSNIMGQAIGRTWKQNKDKENHGATYCSVWKGQSSEVCAGLDGEMAQSPHDSRKNTFVPFAVVEIYGNRRLGASGSKSVFRL